MTLRVTQDEGTVLYEIERLADGVLDAMPEDPYPLRVMQVRAPCPCPGLSMSTGNQPGLETHQL